MKPVCLVIGAGAGIGGTVGKRFAKEGYHAVLCRRSNEEGLNKLVAEIQDDGGEATGFLLNAVKEDTIEERVKQVEAEIGPIEVIGRRRHLFVVAVSDWCAMIRQYNEKGQPAGGPLRNQQEENALNCGVHCFHFGLRTTLGITQHIAASPNRFDIIVAACSVR